MTVTNAKLILFSALTCRILYVSNNLDHFTKAFNIPGPPASDGETKCNAKTGACTGKGPAGGNFDAYSTGHNLAIEYAKKATTLKGTSGSLEMALLMNACSNHFLSDSFAAGHMRTPAQQLFFHGDDSEWKLRKNIDGLLAMNMHNNDNHLGLTVSNKAGDTWFAMGDACMDHPAAAENYNRHLAVLTNSAFEVFQAYKNSELRGGTGVSEPSDFVVENEIPYSADVQNIEWAKTQGTVIDGSMLGTSKGTSRASTKIMNKVTKRWKK